MTNKAAPPRRCPNCGAKQNSRSMRGGEIVVQYACWSWSNRQTRGETCVIKGLKRKVRHLEAEVRELQQAAGGE